MRPKPRSLLMMVWPKRLWRTLMSGMVCGAAAPAAPPGLLHVIAPQATDGRIVDNDADNYAFTPTNASAQAKLLVFIGGSKTPMNDFAAPFLDRAAAHGYRVIGLDYRYDPPGTALCEMHGQGDCFSRYRGQKVFGTGHMPGIEVTPPEGIVHRLAALLAELGRRYPHEGWDGYLVGGRPNWALIALSGFSQGAGLAAFLAKSVPVARVVLLSSPWDHYDESGTLADWLSAPSATPGDRWYGLYAAGEQEAAWLGRAYAALGIPDTHIRVLQGKPRDMPLPGKDTFHWSVIGRGLTPRDDKGGFAYQPDWDFVLDPKS